MNKKVIVAVVVIVVVLAGGALLLSRNTSNKSDDMNMNTQSSGSNTQNTPKATNTVTIQNFAFSPASITIKKGTTVTWTNKDSATHTVTESDSSTGPDSGDLANGKSYSFTYNQTGTFSYHCSIHPNMTGTVKVTE